MTGLKVGQEKKHLLQVDGLRGFLALYVFAFHLNEGAKFKGDLSWLVRFFYKGGGSPYFFFVLSGFLLMNSYLQQKEKAKLWHFYVRRFFRIFPLLWLVLIVKVITSRTPLGWIAFENAFLLFGFHPYRVMDLPVYVGWSLFVEETYYFSIPLIAKFKNSIFLFLGFLFFVTTSEIFDRLDLTYHFIGKNEQWKLPFNTFDFLFAGIILQQAYVRGLFNSEKWSRTSVVILDFATLLLIINFFFNDWNPSLNLGVLLTVTALVEKSLFCRFVWNSQILQWAGVRCYSIYLIHPLIVDNFKIIFRGLFWAVTNENIRVLVEYVIATGCLILAAETGYRFIEGPFNRLGKRLVSYSSSAI